MPDSPYAPERFDPSQEPIRNSARLVVPMIVELLQPGSVCDVGCGRGVWLSVFQEHGVEDLWGVDARHAVDQLELPPERFVQADLAEGVNLDRSFDLAVCLDVAERLRTDSAAPLIAGLVGLAPAVLFSAAVPHQGGEHANEQWPDYWAAHFRRHGFVAVDCVRPKVWKEDQIQVRYAQNTLLFADQALVDSRPRLRREYERSRPDQLSVVHPKILQRVARSSRPRAAAAKDAVQRQQPFETRLESLDPGLFDRVPSQSTRADRISLLALHNACRQAYGRFQYLEIGSHLGGSLQALIADDRCTAITSIDSRPARQRDARGQDFSYPGNSTERMLAYLRTVPGADLGKLRAIEASTNELPVTGFEGAARLCFIDAEHTYEAALRDARFCRAVIGAEGAIAFHDRRLVWAAIEDFTGELDHGSFTAYQLPNSIFVIELGPPRLVGSDWVAGLVEEPGAKLAT